jgi:hypothetical protein
MQHQHQHHVTAHSAAQELQDLNTALLAFAAQQKIRRALDTSMFKCWIHREHMKKAMPQYKSYSLVANMIVLTA